MYASNELVKRRLGELHAHRLGLPATTPADKLPITGSISGDSQSKPSVCLARILRWLQLNAFESRARCRST